jgi:hypothetical protein
MVTRRFVLAALPAIAAYPRLWSQNHRALPTDAELTKNLVSAPGPTFRVTDKSVKKGWTLIAYGDMRFTDPTNDKVTNPKVRRWLVERIAAEHPDALLLSGDVPYDGSVVNDYEVYRQETSAWREAKLRVYPAIGNHELHGDELVEPNNWWQAFPEFKGRRWYSVEMGNAYIVSLDSNLSLLEGTRQHEWLVDQLAHIPAATQFVFVSLHHPPVADSIENSNSHDVRPNELALAQLLEKRAAVSSAKFIVIAGHIHNYQRFLQRGVIYLVSGGGGAKPHPIAQTPADQYQDASFPNYHYLKFTCNEKGLSAKMLRVQNPEGVNPMWEIKDSFVISARD